MPSLAGHAPQPHNPRGELESTFSERLPGRKVKFCRVASFGVAGPNLEWTSTYAELQLYGPGCPTLELYRTGQPPPRSHHLRPATPHYVPRKWPALPVCVPVDPPYDYELILRIICTVSINHQTVCVHVHVYLRPARGARIPLAVRRLSPRGARGASSRASWRSARPRPSAGVTPRAAPRRTHGSSSHPPAMITVRR